MTKHSHPRDLRETIKSDLEIVLERQLDQATRDAAQDGQERYVEREAQELIYMIHALFMPQLGM